MLCWSSGMVRHNNGRTDIITSTTFDPVMLRRRDLEYGMRYRLCELRVILYAAIVSLFRSNVNWIGDINAIG